MGAIFSARELERERRVLHLESILTRQELFLYFADKELHALATPEGIERHINGLRARRRSLRRRVAALERYVPRRPILFLSTLQRKELLSPRILGLRAQVLELSGEIDRLERPAEERDAYLAQRRQFLLQEKLRVEADIVDTKLDLEQHGESQDLAAHG